MVQNDLRPVLSWPGSFITIKKILTVSSKLVGTYHFFQGGVGGVGGWGISEGLDFNTGPGLR